MRKAIAILGILLGFLVFSLILLGQASISTRLGSSNQIVSTPPNSYDPAYYGLPPTIGGYKVFAVLTPDNTACLPPGTRRLVLQAIQPNAEQFLQTNNSADIKTDLEQRGLGEYYKWGVQIVGPGIVREEFLAENDKSTEFRRKFGCVTSVPAGAATLTPAQ